MIPSFLAAAAVYDREPCARTFEADLFLHLLHGIVVSTPEVFAMVRPVCREWPLAWLRDPERIEPDGDCWWIWLAAGDVRRLFEWPLPVKKWVGFERVNALRLHRYSRLYAAFRSSSAGSKPGTHTRHSRGGS